MRAGKLRHRVSLQRYQYVGQDPDTGEELRQWQDARTCWASIEPLSVREMIAAQAEQSKVSARITIRYTDDVDAAMRVVHTKRGTKKFYNIEGVLPDNDSGLEYLTLAVSEGVRA